MLRIFRPTILANCVWGSTCLPMYLRQARFFCLLRFIEVHQFAPIQIHGNQTTKQLPNYYQTNTKLLPNYYQTTTKLLSNYYQTTIWYFRQSFLLRKRPCCKINLSCQPGVDIMITIFCDLSQLFLRKMAFFLQTNVRIQILQKLAVFEKKTPIFSPNF
jgi:hypothetical protein